MDDGTHEYFSQLQKHLLVVRHLQDRGEIGADEDGQMEHGRLLCVFGFLDRTE